MKTESLKFPLHAELNLRLPKGARITGVTVSDDITFLTIESGDDVPALSDVRQVSATFPTTPAFMDTQGRTVEMEEHTIYSYFEGEKKGEDLILIPEESDTLRKLGVVEVQDPKSTFHIFEKVQP